MNRKEFERLLGIIKNDSCVYSVQEILEAQSRLEPFKVKNAIIMAEGMSSRFAPLSL